MSELILTQAGQQAIADAIASGQPLQIAQVVVGDAGITSWAPASPQPPVWQPDAATTTLPGECWRGAPVDIRRNGYELTITAVIPQQTGGWWLHAAGLLDASGTLIAVAALQPTYVSTLAETTLRLTLAVSSTSAVSLQVPAQTLATREWVDEQHAARDTRAGGLLRNATGLLGDVGDWPGLQWVADPAPPGAAGCWEHRGYIRSAHGPIVPIDPARVYEISVQLCQEGVPGDWSAYTYGARHAQYVGCLYYDADLQLIRVRNYACYHTPDGVSSRTVLTQPLSPGDTVVRVADASGWNDTDSGPRGLVIYGYRDSRGRRYTHYSRAVWLDTGAWSAGAVDVAAGTITLSTPVPPSLANPDHPDGTWPPGTPVANAQWGGGPWHYPAAQYRVVPQTDRWYRVWGYIAGTNLGGRWVHHLIPPGAAYIQPGAILQYTAREGGIPGWPDIGPDAAVWMACPQITPAPHARIVPKTDGSADVIVPRADATGSSVELLRNPTNLLEEVAA